MSGDTLKRVQAVKKWLERAESSYSSHKDITGEINLIMAQAEMQRLKETRKPSRFRKWGLRGCAMIVAALLFFVGSSLVQVSQEPKAEPSVSTEVAQSEPPAATPSAASQVPEPPAEKNISTDEPAPEVAADTSAVTTVSEPAAASVPVPAVPVAPAVTTATPKAPPAPAAPALSEKEIQSVVGEAGRALRGQN